VPAPGDWHFFYVRSSGVTFTYALILYSRYGIAIENASPTLTGNILSYNGNAISVLEGSPHISYNDIAGNGGGLFKDTSSTLRAESNWWGHPSGPYHPATNPQALGDRVGDNVDYSPWLTAPANPLYDLSITDIGATDAFAAYDPGTINLCARVRNDGPATAPVGAMIDFYRGSVDPAKWLGSALVAEAIPAGEIRQSTFMTVTLPTTGWVGQTVIAELSPDSDTINTSNNTYSSTFSVHYVDFRMDRDAYSFGDFAWTWTGWEASIQQSLSALLDPAEMVLVLGAIGPTGEWAGHSHGMAAASLRYFLEPTLRPGQGSTFSLPFDEALGDIRQSFFEQMPTVITTGLHGYAEPKTGYETAKALIENGTPVLVTEGLSGQYARQTVIGYKIIEETQHGAATPEHAILLTYDSNYPLSQIAAILDQKAIGFSDLDASPGLVQAGPGTWDGFTFLPGNLDSIRVSEVTLPDAGTETNGDEPARQFSDEPQQVYEALAAGTAASLVARDELMIILGSNTGQAIIHDGRLRRLGYVNGVLVNEIPGAVHDVAPAGQIEVYRLPGTSVYNIGVLGTADDSFDLYVVVPQSRGVTVAAYENVGLTATSLASTRAATGSVPDWLYIDVNGDGIMDQQIRPTFPGFVPVFQYTYLPGVAR
jgi:hypothetical protein